MTCLRLSLALLLCSCAGMATAQGVQDGGSAATKPVPYWLPHPADLGTDQPQPHHGMEEQPRDELAAPPRPRPTAMAQPGEAEPAPANPAPPANAPDCLAPGARLALTFDDGPHATLTPRVLDALDLMGAKATFFLVGQRARAWPETVRDIVRKGHEVGIHTQTHPDLSRLGVEGGWQEIVRGQASILDAAPELDVSRWRAPYGITTGALLRRGRDHGLAHTGWSIDPEDWRRSKQAGLVEFVLGRAHDGDVVLLHDIQPGTVRQLPTLLSRLQERGFWLVTVSQLAWPTCQPPSVALPGPYQSP